MENGEFERITNCQFEYCFALYVLYSFYSCNFLYPQVDSRLFHRVKGWGGGGDEGSDQICSLSLIIVIVGGRRVLGAALGGTCERV